MSKPSFCPQCECVYIIGAQFDDYGTLHYRCRECGLWYIPVDPPTTDSVEWNELLRNIVDWATATFDGATAHQCAAHLLEEAAEVAADPMDGEEWADVFMLAVHGAHRAGVDLRAEVAAKLAKNKARTWERVGEYWKGRE